MNKNNKVYKTIFLSILFIQTLILISVPLIHLMNDSGWYYMSVHFVNEGEYVNESMYPSFKEPSQYYPFLGYSFFLFICNKAASFLGIGIAMVVKCCQLLMYVISGVLVQRITLLMTQKEKLAYIIGIIFLLYYPYFNYVNLVMSETYATFLIILTIYFFIKVQINFNGITAMILFLLSGYIILVKPVFLPISIVIVILFLITVIRNRKYPLLLCVLVLFIFPISQSLFSKVYYGNYKLQTGFGWHMWDRVISYDKLKPHSSEHLKELEEIYAKKNKTVPFGYWWNVTKDLSEFGYSELETQKICEKIAMDAIADHPLKFIGKTFKNCYFNFLQIDSDAQVYSNSTLYLDEINRFAVEQQHKPLTNELSKQTYYGSFFLNDLILSLNFKYSKWSNYLNYLFHNSFIFSLFVLAGIHSIYIILSSGFRKNNKEFLIWFSAFSIIFGSNLAEYPQARLMQPAVIIIILILAIKINEIRLNLTQKKPFNQFFR